MTDLIVRLIISYQKRLQMSLMHLLLLLVALYAAVVEKAKTVSYEVITSDVQRPKEKS